MHPYQPTGYSAADILELSRNIPPNQHYDRLSYLEHVLKFSIARELSPLLMHIAPSIPIGVWDRYNYVSEGIFLLIVPTVSS